MIYYSNSVYAVFTPKKRMHEHELPSGTSHRPQSPLSLRSESRGVCPLFKGDVLVLMLLNRVLHQKPSNSQSSPRENEIFSNKTNK